MALDWVPYNMLQVKPYAYLADKEKRDVTGGLVLRFEDVVSKNLKKTGIKPENRNNSFCT